MYHDERYNIDRIYNKVWNKKTVLNSKIKAFCLLGYFTTNKPLIYEELDTKYYYSTSNRYISKVCIFQILKSTIVIRNY